MNTKPDTISINASSKRTLTADFATATVVIEGSAAFSGEKAFKKATEVSELVDALIADGMERERVTIQDVQVESNSFAGISSSSCRYTLKVSEIPADLLPTVLGTIASRKQADLRSLRWIFSKLEAETETLRQEVIEKSLTKAHSTASTLGISILGVFSFVESIDAPGEARQNFGDESFKAARMRKGKSPSRDLGFSLVHSGRLKISTATEFRVSPIEGAPPN